MKGQRQVLYPQLGRLEGERGLIGEAITEIKGRFEGIDEVESWSMLALEPSGPRRNPAGASPQLYLGFWRRYGLGCVEKPGLLPQMVSRLKGLMG